MSLRRAVAALLCCTAMGGCAVGAGQLNLAADRRFERAALEAVLPGMDEAAVVAALGLPAAFGVDDRGRRYLQYNQYSMGAHVLGAGTGFVGVNATRVRSAARGFEARVYLAKGRVTRVATRVFASAPGDEAGSEAVDEAWQEGGAPLWQDRGRAHLLDDPA